MHCASCGHKLPKHYHPCVFNKNEAKIELSFDEWLAYGEANEYCTKQFCITHDGAPFHPSEEAEWDAGFDPCCHAVRLGSMEDWDVS